MRDPDIFDLPRFREALANERPKALNLPYDTYYRYKEGRLPRCLIALLQRRPDLARALCDDLTNAPQNRAAS